VKTVKITIDGSLIEVAEKATVLEAIWQAGIYVPTLCHDPDLKPHGACRLCIVQIEGMRGLPTACTTPVQAGMVVRTETDEIHEIRRTIVELAIAGHPYDCLVCEKSRDCELLAVARYLGVKKDSVDRSTPDFFYHRTCFNTGCFSCCSIWPNCPHFLISIPCGLTNGSIWPAFAAGITSVIREFRWIMQ